MPHAKTPLAPNAKSFARTRSSRMRAHKEQDQRLDWRDPDMPVIREYKMANGEVVNLVDPDYERRYRAFKMTQPSPEEF